MIFIKIAYAVSTIISYSLQGYCIIIITWTNFLKPKVKMVRKHFIYEMFLRNFIVVMSCMYLQIFETNPKDITRKFITVLIAIVVPRKVDLYMIIIGGAIMPIVGMVFPTLLHIMVYYQNIDGEEPGKFHVIILLDVALIMAGLFICITSIVYFVSKIKESESDFLDIHIKP